MRSRLVRATAAAGGGGFAPPDIAELSFNSAANNSGFNAGEVFPQAGGGAFLLASPTGGRSGSRCARVLVPEGSSDLFYPVGYAFGRRSRIFFRFWVRCPPGMYPTGNFKGFRFHDTGSGVGNNGEWYSDWTVAFDHEGGAATVATGLHWAGQPVAEASYGITPTAINLADGLWHSFQIDYNRAAGANCEIRLWSDGIPVILPPGPAFSGVFSPSNQHPDIDYVGGDLEAGEPTIIRVARGGGGLFLTDVHLPETISGGPGGEVTQDCDLYTDDWAFSTQQMDMAA